jgi:DNA-binding response OmpR family regulator
MPKAHLEKIQALIVEDFDSFRITLFSTLRELGVVNIDSAASSNEAMRLCANKSYDIILCDQNLGLGKSGQYILEELRHTDCRNKNSLFVLISAETDKNTIMAAFDNEPDAYLTKPISAQALKQRIGALLKQRVALASVYRALKESDTSKAVEKGFTELSKGNRYAGQCQKILGKLLLGAGRVNEAEHLYNDVLQSRRLDWAMFGMAKAKELQGDSTDAQRWLTEAIQLNPLYLKAYDSLATILGDAGRTQSQQEILEQALALSPLSLLRQYALGNSALKNNDVTVAASAFRKAVKLGEHSFHDCLDAHVKFARTTLELAAIDKVLAKPLLREALQSATELSSRFGKSDDNKVNSCLLESQLLAAAGDDRQSKAVLNAAKKFVEQHADSLSLTTTIEWVKALQVQGDKAEAGRLTKALLKKHADDDFALQKIDSLLDEPTSQFNKALVEKINKQGIDYYNANNFIRAIDAFNGALQSLPLHIGLRLNLVQALIQLFKINSQQKTWAMAQQMLSYASTLISSSHAQFRRFKQLEETLKQCDMAKPTQRVG